MPDTAALILFFAAALALLLTPGPAVLYIVAWSVDRGPRAGILSALGVGVGTLVHVGAAAFGVSALLASSVVAFSVVKYLGAAYLIYLGVRKFVAPATPAAATVPEPASLARIFWQGVVVNILNPKTALFVLAFIPQFVSVESGHVAAQIVVLGFMFAGLGVVTDSLYAIAAGSAGVWLRRRSSFIAVQRYVTGSVLIALGVVSALAGSHRK